jgi:hypothetical protein
MNDTQIESLLRQAPRPAPRPDLQRHLRAAIRLPQPEELSREHVNVVSFWRRWFPAFAVGLFFLGCLIVLGVQTVQILDLRRENAALELATANLEDLRRNHAETRQLNAGGQETERQREDREELLKLRTEVAELRDRAGELTTLRAENQRLQAKRAALLAQAGVAPADDPFAKAKEKSMATQCVNNLKQIGLAARMWANEHKTNLLPLDWLAMKNELPTPRLLTCPADTARRPAVSWEQFDGSSVSYELPSAAPDERDPSTVYSRCSVHGSIGLTDGSAIMKMNPAQLQQVNGNLKLQKNAR